MAGKGEHPLPSSSLPATPAALGVPSPLRAAAAAAPKGRSGKSLQLREAAAGLQQSHATPTQKRGAGLIADKSSGAAYCCAGICAAVRSREEPLPPQRADLRSNGFRGEKYNTGAGISLRERSMEAKGFAGKGGKKEGRQEGLKLWEV